MVEALERLNIESWPATNHKDTNENVAKVGTFGIYLIIRIELDQDLLILGVDLENRLDRYHGGKVSGLLLVYRGIIHAFTED